MAASPPEIMPIPPGQKRKGPDRSWWCGPIFIVGIFLVAHVAAAVPMQASLRLLAAAAGLGLAIPVGKGIARPWTTAFFWGGLFWAWGARGLPPAFPGAGLLLAAVAGAVYVAAARRPAA
jgi:hypothetical protein